MHLGKYSTVSLVPAILGMTLLAGCIIVGSGQSGTTSVGGVGGGIVDTTSGAGGEPDTTSGAGGEPTTATTTTTTGSGQSCVGMTGTAVVSDCDKLNIAPANGASSICGPNKTDPPYGYDACTHAFEIYTTGAASDLLSCLATIGVENECNTDLVIACVSGMQKDLCYDMTIADDCSSLDKDCANAGQGHIDLAQCQRELTPLTDKSIVTLDGCINQERAKPGTMCQAAYDTCYDSLL